MNDLFTFAATHYPSVPGYKSRETSAAAAMTAEKSAPRLRQLCLDQLRLCGPMTADEIAESLRIDKLSIRPRCSELSAMGKITDSGQRRENSSGKRAIVWAIVEPQRLAA